MDFDKLISISFVKEPIIRKFAFATGERDVSPLVIKGIKKGTSSYFNAYLAENEEIPKTGEASIVLDNSGNEKCVIINTNVTVQKFNEMGAYHAFIEGEDYEDTFNKWYNNHLNWLKSEYENFKIGDLIVFEEFKVVFTEDSINRINEIININELNVNNILNYQEVDNISYFNYKLGNEMYLYKVATENNGYITEKYKNV
jgi:uncharacterized protein YhfF